MSKTMTNMSKEEKRMMLFDMQEHPEKYTDEQVERLLADEAVKEFSMNWRWREWLDKKPIRRRWMWMRLGRNLFRHITRIRWRWMPANLRAFIATG